MWDFREGCTLKNSHHAVGAGDYSGQLASCLFLILMAHNFVFDLYSGAYAEELEHSGLARQVSTLLTNHLARATECSGNEAAGNEALQEVLSLLNDLSRQVIYMAIWDHLFFNSI